MNLVTLIVGVTYQIRFHNGLIFNVIKPLQLIKPRVLQKNPKIFPIIKQSSNGIERSALRQQRISRLKLSATLAGAVDFHTHTGPTLVV